jgi:hypothetical protein
VKEVSEKIENTVVVGFSPKLEARVKQLEDRIYELDCALLKQAKLTEGLGQQCLSMASVIRDLLLMVQRAGL